MRASLFRALRFITLSYAFCIQSLYKTGVLESAHLPCFFARNISENPKQIPNLIKHNIEQKTQRNQTPKTNQKH